MTNLVTALIITVSTNWTASGDPAREVGTIVTNYEAQCIFMDKTNLFQLEKRYADAVAWRTARPTIIVATNQGYYWNIPGQLYLR